jgi:hypothetical protein
VTVAQSCGVRMLLNEKSLLSLWLRRLSKICCPAGAV